MPWPRMDRGQEPEVEIHGSLGKQLRGCAGKKCIPFSARKGRLRQNKWMRAAAQWLLPKWNTWASCRRVEPGGLRGISGDVEKKKGLVGWRLRCCKRAAPVAEAAGQQQEGAAERAAGRGRSGLQEPEVTSARGRSEATQI
ncbi:hypothetical protein GW17_00052753 [Ensete ventricosum]|nr:hypothetical protein GW17_00052753 [Ensete ventricosum]